MSEAYLSEYSGDKLIAVSILFIVLDICFVAFRFTARLLRRISLAWEDWLILPALLLNVGSCVIGIVIVQHGGAGRHITAFLEREPEITTTWAKCVYSFVTIYLSAVALPKLSILFLYLRVFSEKGRIFRCVCYLTIIVVFLTALLFTFANIFSCWPIDNVWKGTFPGTKCFDIPAFYRSTSIPNIVTDLVMFILPLPALWGLNLSTIKKIGLVMTFATGSLGIVLSCIRCSVFFRSDAFTDDTWASVHLIGWSIAESGVYLISACLPVLRPLIGCITPKRVKKLTQSSSISDEEDQRHFRQFSEDSQEPRHFSDDSQEIKTFSSFSSD